MSTRPIYMDMIHIDLRDISLSKWEDNVGMFSLVASNQTRKRSTVNKAIINWPFHGKTDRF